MMKKNKEQKEFMTIVTKNVLIIVTKDVWLHSIYWTLYSKLFNKWFFWFIQKTVLMEYMKIGIQLKRSGNTYD
jgi:hypothetical protein